VTAAALERMQAFRWPGNVRQLINALEYGVITCRGEEIDVQDLPASIAADAGCPPRAAPRRPDAEAIRTALAVAGGAARPRPGARHQPRDALEAHERVRTVNRETGGKACPRC